MNKQPLPTEAQTGEASHFDDLAPPSAAQLEQARASEAAQRSVGTPRLLQPNRSQTELRASVQES